MPATLAGLPIIITGASSGIGRATAFACAQQGMPVVVAARREDRLREVVEQIRSQGGRAIAHACDVASEADARTLVGAAVQAFGPPYAVFANAGYGEELPAHASAAPEHANQADEAFRRMIDVNYWGSVYVLRAALPHLRVQRRGHLLLCSSCLAKLGTPMYSAYSMSKAMQDHLARAMRIELADQNIAVSSVHPVGTRTEFFDQVASKGGKLLSKTPDIFMQRPERVARAVVRCLRSPRGEVWTSLPMRAALAMGTLLPGMTDMILRQMYRSRMRAAQKQ